MSSESFDKIWENQIYSKGRHLSRYPFDMVVSFVYRNYPRDKPRSEVNILEVGCGAANNLWFAAREGFSVAGIDGSASAVKYALDRFRSENLQGDIRVGDFTRLPFKDHSFDLVIDRAALTCCGRTSARQAVNEIHRVLKPGGCMLFNPYADDHSSREFSQPGLDGERLNITSGTLVGVGQICFYGKLDIARLFSDGWKIKSMQHVIVREHIDSDQSVHAEWRVVAEKATRDG